MCLLRKTGETNCVIIHGCRFTVHRFSNKLCKDWECSSLQSLFLDLNPDWNTSRITMKRELFNYCPSTKGQFARFLRQTQIVILEILKCIPAVTIFAFLELNQIFLFVDGH